MNQLKETAHAIADNSYGKKWRSRALEGAAGDCISGELQSKMLAIAQAILQSSRLQKCLSRRSADADSAFRRGLWQKDSKEQDQAGLAKFCKAKVAEMVG